MVDQEKHEQMWYGPHGESDLSSADLFCLP